MGNILFSMMMVLSFFIVFLLSRKFIARYVPVSSQGRLSGIDGLRGYLALMVAVHHFYIFFYWRAENKWEEPSTVFFNNLGVFAVGIFFMITGFLFIGKVDKSRSVSDFDFLSILKSRFYRIFPLYFFAIAISILVSMLITNFELRVEPYLFLKQIAKWFFFIGDTVNGYTDAKRITAGVTWTLRYEWLFYLSLFFIYYLSGFKYGLTVLGIVAIVIAYLKIDVFVFNSMYLIFFVMGGGVYFINKSMRAVVGEVFFKRKIFSVLSCVAIVIAMLTPAKNNLLLFGVFSFLFFLSVVMGNDLFGLLSLHTSKILGEISYSIYLMHGIVLFVLFKFLYPYEDFFVFSEYIILLPLFLFVVVAFSAFTYLKIEHPFIIIGKKRSAAELSKKQAG
ncbi:acyltransferase family protein [Klebsiella pneumoniae]